MKTPIPQPKSFRLADGSVPAPSAESFRKSRYDAEFNGAVRAYLHYTRNRKSVSDTPIFLKKEALDGADYKISVTESSVTVTAADNENMNRAFATLVQLEEEKDGIATMPCCEIEDKADSRWRGLMLDLSRCWHESDYLFREADLCWLCKANRLQLHLTDDQGIRFPFKAFPNAVHEEHYTEEEIQRLVDYCADRGIVLVPEIDAPGHALPFNESYPGIFGSTPSIMCASEKTFDALKIMYEEVANAFPNSPYIHIGGDEAAIRNWLNCETSKEYMAEHGIADERKLYGHYILRLAQIVRDLGKIPVVWEGFSKECNDMLPKDILVFAWESYYQLATDLLESGFTVLNASWLPNYIVCGPNGKYWDPEEILDWEKNRWCHWWENSVASKEPIVVSPDAAVDGGQMCSWGDHMRPEKEYAPRREMCDEEAGLIQHRFPALCEKLWNSYTSPDKGTFMTRLAELEDLFGKIR